MAQNHNNDGNGRPNEWYNSKFLVLCMLIGVAIICWTIYLVVVTANSSKTVEKEKEGARYRELMMHKEKEIRELQAKNNENVSG
jgi:type VI protein secretion system component VasK